MRPSALPHRKNSRVCAPMISASGSKPRLSSPLLRAGIPWSRLPSSSYLPRSKHTTHYRAFKDTRSHRLAHHVHGVLPGPLARGAVARRGHALRRAFGHRLHDAHDASTVVVPIAAATAHPNQAIPICRGRHRLRAAPRQDLGGRSLGFARRARRAPGGAASLARCWRTRPSCGARSTTWFRRRSRVLDLRHCPASFSQHRSSDQRSPSSRILPHRHRLRARLFSRAHPVVPAHGVPALALRREPLVRALAADRLHQLRPHRRRRRGAVTACWRATSTSRRATSSRFAQGCLSRARERQLA